MIRVQPGHPTIGFFSFTAYQTPVPKVAQPVRPKVKR